MVFINPQSLFRIRVQSPIPEWMEANKEYAKETMIFNKMRITLKESLQDFHSRLSAQADKCGFQCYDCPANYKLRMIRDRLLLAVDDDLQKLILSRNADPSDVDILNIYDENQKVSQHYQTEKNSRELNLLYLFGH